MKTESGVISRPCFDPPSKEFVLAKPVQRESYDEKIIYELEKQGRLIITRKRNGYKLFAIKAKGKWKIYTDGFNEIFCVDHIKQELEKLKLPNKTWLAGEGIVDIKDSDDFSRVAGILKSGKERALRIQKEIGFVKLMVFGVIFWENKCRISDPYSEQLELIKKMLGKKQLKHLLPVTVLDLTFDEAKKKVAEEKKINSKSWEGLVLYDRNFVSSYRLDGKNPKRPTGCYKWKPIYEDDFIVRELAMNEKDKIVKEVLLCQIDPVTRQEFSCGKFGLFSAEKRNWLATAGLPLVIQLEFEDRSESGKLINARIGEIGFRNDKKPENCIAPKNFEIIKNPR